MKLNLKKIFISFIFLALLSVVSILLFPPVSRSAVYDLNRHEYPAEPNFLSYISIIIGTLGLIIYNSQVPDSEKVKIISPEEIFEFPETQQTQANFGITNKSSWVHRKYVGEFSLGHFWLVARENNIGNLIWFVILGNENYQTTKTKDQLTNPLLSVSDTYPTMALAERGLLPTERGSFESKLKKIQKEILRSGENKSYASGVMEKIKEQAEEEVEEGE